MPATLPENTFIIDNGAYNIKAGFAPGEEEADDTTAARCRQIPNAFVKSRDRKTYIAAQAEESLTHWSEAVYRRPAEHGQIVSWEVQKAIWDYSFISTKATADVKVSDPSSTTLILGECPNMLPILEKNADEIIMEEYGFGGYFRANSTFTHSPLVHG